jgi:hypothetical protein
MDLHVVSTWLVFHSFLTVGWFDPPMVLGIWTIALEIASWECFVHAVWSINSTKLPLLVEIQVKMEAWLSTPIPSALEMMEVAVFVVCAPAFATNVPKLTL